MLKKKQKRQSLSDYLRYMHMIEDGYSFSFICNHYGSDEKTLKVLWYRYQKFGIDGLSKKRNFMATPKIKKKIVLDIEKNHLSLHAASIKYGPSTSPIKVWLRIYRSEGLSGLDRVKKRGRPPGMGRPRKNSKPLTELERLRKEVQELRTENALLKKVRALVEERNARLRAIGQGPSKN
jgi:transposase-like protein